MTWSKVGNRPMLKEQTAISMTESCRARLCQMRSPMYPKKHPPIGLWGVVVAVMVVVVVGVVVVLVVVVVAVLVVVVVIVMVVVSYFAFFGTRE